MADRLRSVRVQDFEDLLLELLDPSGRPPIALYRPGSIDLPGPRHHWLRTMEQDETRMVTPPDPDRLCSCGPDLPPIVLV